MRYRTLSPKERERVTTTAVQGLLAQAKRLIGIPPRAITQRPMSLDESHLYGHSIEIDAEASLDHALSRGVLTPEKQDLHGIVSLAKSTPVLLILDLSISMRGEKRALLLASTISVALGIPEAQLALMGFDSEPRWIKRWDEPASPATLARRVLEFAPSGFTHITAALREAAQTLPESRRHRTHVILISDGRYTEGEDPLGLAPELASHFFKLSTLKLGRDVSGFDLMKQLAERGNGEFIEARKIELLPRALYQLIRGVIR